MLLRSEEGQQWAKLSDDTALGGLLHILNSLVIGKKGGEGKNQVLIQTSNMACHQPQKFLFTNRNLRILPYCIIKLH